MPFLTARWANLLLATYPVPAELLEPRLPPGLVLDTRDGHPCVSLVAFQFLNARVLGIPWPGFRNFAELNLRFYVRHGGERGVMFIREFVPQRAVAWAARYFYNEPYLAAPLTSRIEDGLDRLTAEYRLTYGGRQHRIMAAGRKPAVRPPDDSIEHFFKEHHWGFGVMRNGTAIRYAVSHPVWNVFPVEKFEHDLDWETVYGPEWKILENTQPLSVILAVGSPVAVFWKRKLGAPAEARLQPQFLCQEGR